MKFSQQQSGEATITYIMSQNKEISQDEQSQQHKVTWIN